jgi:peroxiredoxin Q/BCP
MLTVVAMALMLSPLGDNPKLQVGDQAPAFSLPASNGKTISLAEFKGKQKVVLAFFPKAFTGG